MVGVWKWMCNSRTSHIITHYHWALFMSDCVEFLHLTVWLHLNHGIFWEFPNRSSLHFHTRWDPIQGKKMQTPLKKSQIPRILLKVFFFICFENIDKHLPCHISTNCKIQSSGWLSLMLNFNAAAAHYVNNEFTKWAYQNVCWLIRYRAYISLDSMHLNETFLISY